jgi:ATP-dependent Clp protease adaptor protein ClpS
MSLPALLPGVETGSEEQNEEVKLWNVVLLDDNEHSYDYVIEMLCRLFWKTVEEAYDHAVEVDSSGRTIVMTCEEDPALFAKRQIEAYGADPRMSESKGSMSAVLEAV